ncbi:MAG: hypothetical protein H6738_19885 [Alphaproteobacteria bacterium]|nr:hypothetical protein [Alphaproteobacteria bacterium]MCB9699052.1 hypothetical protein [Alphaproteobacteria bacterium]
MRRLLVLALIWGCKGKDGETVDGVIGDDDDDVVGDDDDDDVVAPPGELDHGRLCTTGGWCWETPQPGGGTNGGIWALSPDDVWVTNQTHLFHLGPDGIGHAQAPTLIPYLNWVPVFGVASDDVWAHGFSSFIHWDGHVWSTLNTGTFASSIHGIASDDVWASGFSSIMHWDGGSWTQAHQDGSFGDSYVDVWQTGANSVFVGGMRSNVGGKVWRFDGTTLTDLGYPSSANTYVIAVWAASANDLWAVAGDGAFHWDGTTWEQKLSGWGTVDVWGSGPDDVWILDQAQSAVHHWDGSSLTQEPVEGAYLPYRLAGAGGEIWVTGYEGSIHHRSASGVWDVLKETYSSQTVVDMAEDPSGAHWFATNDVVMMEDGAGNWSSEPGPVQWGVTGLGEADGDLLLFANRSTWQRGPAGDWSPVPSAADLVDACTLDDGTVLGVGDRLATRIGSEWITQDPAPNQSLGRVICHGDEAFATTVGDYEILEDPTELLRYEDGAWQHLGLRSVLGSPLLSSWAPAANQVWAVFDGAPSMAMAYDGTSWAEVPLGFEARGVGGTASDTWIVGLGGAARRTTGDFVEVADTPFADFRWVGSDGAGGATLLTLQGSVWTYSPTAGTRWREVVPAHTRPIEDALFVGGQLFAVDDSGYALGLVGTTWQQLPGQGWADKVEGNETVGVWFQDSSRLYHWDGATNAEVVSSLPGSLFVPSTGNDVLTFGYGGEISVLAGSTFTEESAASLTSVDLAFGHSLDDLWMTGEDTDTRDLAIARRRSGTWAPFAEIVQPVAFGTSSQGDELWIDATQSVWRREPSGAFSQIYGPGAIGEYYAISGAQIRDTNDIWVTAIGGVLHFDGDWDNLGDPLGLGFYGMRTSSDGRAWALGSFGWVASHDP